MELKQNDILADLSYEFRNGEILAELGLGETYLDISALRPEVQRIFNDIALDFDCHRDKVVISAIAAVCAVVGKKAYVRYRHFVNRCSVYAIIVDYKGGIKSSVMKYIMKPIMALDKKMRDDYNAKVMTVKPDEIIPALSTILTRGATSEEKHKLLNASKAGILMWKDEITVYFKERGKYTKKKDTGESQEDCSLWDGTSQAPDRISDKLKLNNSDIAYSILGSTTTPTFAENFTNFFRAETGEYDRYLFIKTDWRPRRHDDFDEKLCSDSKEWEAVIYDLHSMPTNQEYFLHEEAKIKYIDYKNSECIDAINSDPNYQNFLTGYKQRNATYILRLALIFHLLNDWHSDTITLEEMEMSIKCMKVFNVYAERCYNLILETEERGKFKNKCAAEKIRDAYISNNEIGRPAEYINQSALARDLGVSQAAVSKELKKLKESGQI